MKLRNRKIGFVLTGSFYTFKNTIEQMKKLIKEEAKIIPIMSYNAYNLNTRFGKSNDSIKQIEELAQNKIIHTIQSAELIGSKHMTDIMLVAPASRKYYIENSSRDSRHPSYCGNKISFTK